MYRTGEKNPPVTHLNVVFADGGLGDQIARTPAILYTYNAHKHVVMHIWCPIYFKPILERMLPRDRNRLIIRDYTQIDKFNKTLQARVFDSSIHKYTNLAAHMTEHAFEVATYSQVSDEHKNYISFNVDDVDIQKFNLPEKYVVIPPCFTSKVRLFLGKHINTIVDHCKSKGYETVFLGNSVTQTGSQAKIIANVDPEVKLDNGVNLLDKTTLLEAAKIMKGAMCVIGLDSGLLHLGAAVSPDVKLVYGFTTVKPEHRLPYRNNVKGYNCYPVTLSQQELACYTCQSNMTFTYGHNFTQCYYDDTKCIFMLTADRYITQIDRIINERLSV